MGRAKAALTTETKQRKTNPKQTENVLELFQCFVSHARASETKHRFGFVSNLFGVVLVK